MSRELFANNAASTLNGGITDSATTLSVQAGDGALYPDPASDEYFYVTLDDGAGKVEIVKCTARSTDTLTIVRGQQGTSGAAFSSGDAVELRPTFELLRGLETIVLAAERMYFHDPFPSTHYSFAQVYQTGTQQTAGGWATYCPIMLPETVTVVSIGCQVLSAGTASATVRLGLYQADGARGGPGTLLVDAGTVGADTTGNKEIAISQELVRRTLYWGCLLPNEAVGFRAGNTFGVGAGSGLQGAGDAEFLVIRNNPGTGALPDPAGTVSRSSSWTTPIVSVETPA